MHLSSNTAAIQSFQFASLFSHDTEFHYRFFISAYYTLLQHVP